MHPLTRTGWLFLIFADIFGLLLFFSLSNTNKMSLTSLYLILMILCLVIGCLFIETRILQLSVEIKAHEAIRKANNANLHQVK